MMNPNQLNELQEKLQKFIDTLKFYCEYDIPSNPKWDAELVGLFGTDASSAVALLDTVDFNGESEQHLLSYLPNIAKNLKTLASKFLFI